MTVVNPKPEQEARAQIDAMLRAAGWLVQNYRDIDLAAGRAVAIREYPTATGPMDYLLYVDRKALGAIEAKPAGTTLRSVERQTQRYIEGFNQTAETKGTPSWQLPLPFHYISTGYETLFTNLLEPAAVPRTVFAFHKPETLLDWVTDADGVLRKRIRALPVLDEKGLRKIQVKAIKGLEKSISEDKPRALVHMATGSGKTLVAIAESFRMIEHGQAERVLFLVDRINLGWQAWRDFTAYQPPGYAQSFGQMHNIQVLTSNRIDPTAKVVITTIQRLYSILTDQPDLDPALEEESAFETQIGNGDEMLVSYQPKLPIETFDFIFTDECHRSIYGKWGQVLDYFDAFLTGLTATPDKFTYAYFNGNVVAEYTHEQSVKDKVNVDYVVYRIETAITSGGSTIPKGEWVQVRDKYTRQQLFRELDDELTYDPQKLDRAVVSKDQLRTIVRTFKEKLCTEIFPGRTEVPKTIFFCKDDSHAEDVLQIIREEFGRGTDFARKITYKVEGKAEDHIQEFRTDPRFRIAVSVDQISTGSDIKPVECLVFLRFVRSRTLFEQMKGRGVRRIDSTDLRSVTPDAQDKDFFVIVDCVGVTEEERAWAETKPLDRDPGKPLKALLQQVAENITSDNVISTVGVRLIRLARKLNPEQEARLTAIAGRPIDEIGAALIDAADHDLQIEAARAATGKDEPDNSDVAAAREKLVDAAVAPLMKAELRRTIEEIRSETSIVIDLYSQDEVVRAEFIDTGQAEAVVRDFKSFIDQHHDEYAALKAYYARPYRDRLSLGDIKELASAISKPPYALTTEKLWAAYETLDKSKVKGRDGRVLADIVSVVRYTLGADDALMPHLDIVRMRFDMWLTEQQQNGVTFTDDQRRWLEMVRDHIATSMSIETDDFDEFPFRQEGGLVVAYRLFGDRLNPLLEELNRELVAA